MLYSKICFINIKFGFHSFFLICKITSLYTYMSDMFVITLTTLKLSKPSHIKGFMNTNPIFKLFNCLIFFFYI